LGVVFHDHHGVACVGKTPQNSAQALDIPGMQALGRLIQDVGDAHEPSAKGTGKSQPLEFASAQ
jgi:hypothetical protein